MITPKIQALFYLIDFLNSNKAEYIEKYLPLCAEISDLDLERSKLKPRENYKDKQRYDIIQGEITEKFQPITQNICLPVLNKLKELGIWAGDDVYTSIWNSNVSAFYDFRQNFENEDIHTVIKYKQKYLSFRSETNSNFLCLQFVFNNLDEICKILFDFFKDTEENEFEIFEAKTIELSSMQDVAKEMLANKSGNIRFSIREPSLFDYQNVRHLEQPIHHIKNEIIVGDKIQVGDISNNSGEILIGKNLSIANSFNGKTEIAEKINELISILRTEQEINEHDKQSVITNFDKVREEVMENAPDKSKIFKWLSVTKGVMKNLVFTHEVKEAIDWVYSALNFIVH